MELQQALTRFMDSCACSIESFIVGISGGKDSMTLLHVLHSFVQRLDAGAHTKTITVVHVHHGLRQTADRDADFVRANCLRLGIPCIVKRVEVDRESSEGIESAARSARYLALLEVASTYRQPAIVLGHHADDQVETFLLRWLRGTGLHGLGSMHGVSERGGVAILRPFLTVPRDLIEAYASENQVAFVEDETNEDERFRRNYLRRRVIPSLREIQPDLASITARLTQQLQVDNDYLRMQSEVLYAKIVRHTSNHFIDVDIRALSEAHDSLQRRVIHLILNCFASDGWAQQHIDSILRLIAPGSMPSSVVQLPRSVCAWRNYETLYIGIKSTRSTSTGRRQEWFFQDDLTMELEHAGALWRFRRVRFEADWHRLMRQSNAWRLFLPDISGVSVQTGVSTSRKIRPLGLSGSKKLQDVFTDAKVPRELRAGWPIFMVDDALLWVPGVVRSDVELLGDRDKRGWVVLAAVDRKLKREVRTLSDNPPRIIRE